MNRKYLISICSIIAAFSLNVNAQLNFSLPFTGKPTVFAKPGNVSVPRKSQLKETEAETMPVYSIDNSYTYAEEGALTDSTINNRTDLFFTGNKKDSIIVNNYDSDTKKFTPSQKTTFKRDALLRDTLRYQYIYNAGWQPSKQIHTAYDEKGNVILDKEYSWSVSSKVWKGTKFIENAYDDRGNNILYSEYKWNTGTKNWIGNYKYEFFYNYNITSFAGGDNATDSVLYYQWDNLGNKWYLAEKDIYSFTPNGSYSEILIKSRSSVDSLFQTRMDLNFLIDKDGKDSLAYESVMIKQGWFVKDFVKIQFHFETDSLMNLLVQSHDTIKNIWINEEKDFYIFDTNLKKKLATTVYTYDTTANKWVGNFKQRVLWADSIRNSLIVNYTWDETNDVWANADSSLFYYDKTGLQTKMVKYTWSSNAWHGSENKESGYNDKGQLTLSTNYLWKTDNWINNSQEKITFNSSGTEVYHENADWNVTAGSWLSNKIIRYYYTPYIGPSGIATIKSDKKLKVYPNPTSGKIVFDMPPDINSTRIDVYSSTGVLVQSKNITSSTADLSDLNNGLYFIKIKGSKDMIPIFLQK